MPRKFLIRSAEHPYHITGRCNNREPFHCGSEVAWMVFSKNLEEMCSSESLVIHAFVLMPNHFHLLASTPQKNLDVIMHKLMLTVTKTMNMKTGRTGRVFGSRYHWSLVNSMNYFDYVLKYIYRNPVKAGLVSEVDHYPYSTIRGALNSEDLGFRLQPLITADQLIPNGDRNTYLEWLNQPFQKEYEHAIKLGLRKTTFLPARIGWRKEEPKLISVRDS